MNLKVFNIKDKQYGFRNEAPCNLKANSRSPLLTKLYARPTADKLPCAKYVHSCEDMQRKCAFPVSYIPITVGHILIPSEDQTQEVM